MPRKRHGMRSIAGAVQLAKPGQVKRHISHVNHGSHFHVQKSHSGKVTGTARHTGGRYRQHHSMSTVR